MALDAVLLVHGHGAPPGLLLPLQKALNRGGFGARIFSYRSLRGSIEMHAEAFRKFAMENAGEVQRLHIVAHSMGAIVARRALGMWRPENLGRVVLLAPPNRGARLADLAVKLFGSRITAGNELSSRRDSYVNRLPPLPGIEVGVLAARWDHIVSIASTHLDGEKEHRVVDFIHTLPLSKEVQRLVPRFLKTGSFT